MIIGARWDASGPTGGAGTDKAFSFSKLMASPENVRTQANSFQLSAVRHITSCTICQTELTAGCDDRRSSVQACRRAFEERLIAGKHEVLWDLTLPNAPDLQ